MWDPRFELVEENQLFEEKNSSQNANFLVICNEYAPPSPPPKKFAGIFRLFQIPSKVLPLIFPDLWKTTNNVS